jgi:hypothetical protein
MKHAFGDDKPLSWSELNRATFQIDHEPTIDHIEKLVLMVAPKLFSDLGAKADF